MSELLNSKETRARYQMTGINQNIALARQSGECDTVVLCDMLPVNRQQLLDKGYIVKTSTFGYNYIGWANK